MLGIAGPTILSLEEEFDAEDAVVIGKKERG
jgi:hypothetical protein